MEYLLLIVGLVILIVGAELLVKGSVGIAVKFRVSMLVIGMTIVSFGTSAPELLVSIRSALEGHGDIGVGTIIGSNIANISLILGMTALLIPISVQSDSIRIDWPMMMAATLALYFVIQDGWLEFREGVFFLIAIFIFGYWIVKRSRDNNKEHITIEEVKTKFKSLSDILRNVFFVFTGCVGLYYGAELLLDGSVKIAQDFGVSEGVIGLTIVAFGTSVPELITSVVAAYRGRLDISVGNLIGSNIFNILAILGITSLIQDVHIHEDILKSDVYWLLGASFILFPLMFFGKVIGRWKGAVLLLLYCTYIYFVLK